MSIARDLRSSYPVSCRHVSPRLWIQVCRFVSFLNARQLVRALVTTILAITEHGIPGLHVLLMGAARAPGDQMIGVLCCAVEPSNSGSACVDMLS